MESRFDWGSTAMDGSYQLLAARHLRKQTRQLSKQLDGVREPGDVECVHQARVASRRLRAILRVFPECFPRKRVKRWRKHVRRLTRALGPARDQDVQIEFVRGFLAEMHDRALRPGIARLLLRLEQGRRAVQPEMERAVDRFEASGAGSQMLAAAKKMRSKCKKRGVSVRSEFVLSQAGDHLSKRLNQLVAYEDCLDEPEDQEHHHAMRIAAKRLRYTLEIFVPAYGSRVDEFVAPVKTVQTLLGDVHDCDVWEEHLKAFVIEEEERAVDYYGNARPFGALKGGLEYLREDRRSRRQELFGRLVDHWRKLEQEALWAELIQATRSPTESTKGPARSAGAPHAHNGRKPGAARASSGEKKTVPEGPGNGELPGRAAPAGAPPTRLGAGEPPAHPR